MKWFVLVVMLGMNTDGTQDLFIYNEPTLDTLDQCQQYVYQAGPSIRRHMWTEFDGRDIERVYCIREDKLKLFFESQKGRDV